MRAVRAGGGCGAKREDGPVEATPHPPADYAKGRQVEKQRPTSRKGRPPEPLPRAVCAAAVRGPWDALGGARRAGIPHTGEGEEGAGRTCSGRRRGPVQVVGRGQHLARRSRWEGARRGAVPPGTGPGRARQGGGPVSRRWTAMPRGGWSLPAGWSRGGLLGAPSIMCGQKHHGPCDWAGST